MQSASYRLADLDTDRWVELLRVPALSAGLYVIAAGGADWQSPHSEDEIYLVLAGRGALVVGDERYDTVAGTLLFVAASVEHRFVDVVEDLRVLVVFGPAEGSLSR